MSVTVIHDQPLLRTLRNVPRELLPRVLAAIETIIADAPNLPGERDEVLAQTLPALRYARAVPATPWAPITAPGSSRSSCARTAADSGIASSSRRKR